MSTIKVNTITKRTGSTLTLGESGTTVTLACGATQTGFGRTGTVDWCTTAKTSPFTAVSGDGFFVNTTSGAITVTLPASPSAGDIISLKDYANTWDTNSVTLCRNGSKINGVCANAALNTESQSVTLIYVDGTKGWQDIQDSTSNVTGADFIAATGGTITTSGDFKIHTFTADGCFAVSGLATNPANNEVSYMVVAGGGSGGSGFPCGSGSGGGGAGGFRESKSGVDSYTASPLEGATNITVTATTFPITVGAGGAGKDGGAPAFLVGNPGSTSVFSTITSAGGGGGGSGDAEGACGAAGGSGGGGGYGPSSSPGAGNTPPVSPPQGNAGGNPSPGSSAPGYAASGGGGAGAAGSKFPGPQVGGAGGAGVSTEITGSAVTRSGGGGGSIRNSSPGTGGAGGSGGGGAGSPGNSPASGTAGTANTGGGGGGGAGAPGSPSGSGGSGVVVIRYKFQ
jgi:hypothetical protein